MALFSSERIVFIGPGSEWFWTALSGLVLATTFLAIYRQLRLAQHAGAIATMDAFEREWYSERMTRYRLEILVALRDSGDPAAVPIGAGGRVANFWEKIGGLTRRGSLDARLLADAYGADGFLWWNLMKPWVLASRPMLSDPDVLRDFEWLAGRMLKLGQAPAGGNPTEEYLRGSIRRLIEAAQDQVRIEQALREVTFASGPTSVHVRPNRPRQPVRA